MPSAGGRWLLATSLGSSSARVWRDARRLEPPRRGSVTRLSLFPLSRTRSSWKEQLGEVLS
jgi:hypothetical protein